MIIRPLRLLTLLIPAGLLAAAGLAQTAAPAPQSGAGLELFEKKIRPLLVESCYSCHSAKSKPLMGGLALDSREGLLKGGTHGPAIVPGKPEESVLIRAVHFTDKSLQMPPKGKLTDAQISALTEWVRLGAPDPRTAAGPKKLQGLSVDEGRRHWAFLPLKRVSIPSVPASKAGIPPTWARTAVDRFVLTKLQEKGHTPNPIADRRTLVRRAYFDLIGLPPTPEEVQAFLNDRSPDAYEKLIDRLLASPHYGERWGRHWLDLARFAESHGYEQDYDRPNAYTYRDFVIKALNQDMPYDQFVKWQLAGDEFEPENPMALMATGFLAAGTHATQITKNQVEKERYDELDDMLSTTSSSMLGLTVGCARCHYHKYDPIPSTDYYRMLSTFTTTVRSDYDVNLDPEGYRKAKVAFDEEHAKQTDALAKWEKETVLGRFEKWLDTKALLPARAAWVTPELVTSKSAGGATLTPQADGSLLASGKNPDNDIYTLVYKTGMKSISALRLEALADPSLVKGGPGRAANGNFALTDLKVTAGPVGAPVNNQPIKIKTVRADFEQKGLPAAAIIDADAKSAWAVDPQFGKSHAVVLELETPVGYEQGTELTFTLKFDNNVAHSIGRPRISVAGNASAPLEAEARPEHVERALEAARQGQELSGEDRMTLLRWYRTQDPEWKKLDEGVRAHLAAAPKPPLQKALISSEGVPAVRTHTQGGDFLEATHILKRGDPNQKGEVATQGFLQVLVRAADGEKRWQVQPPKDWRTSYRRRSFANWITDVDAGAGQLLARVIVNRLWQHHMGRGIVGTPSDFGTQGERPINPELLDYLASELIRGGWKLKPIHKLIMTSAVYMQTASTQTKAAKVDPGNKLCWRQNRRRLEAEVIRDSMLSVSGLLDPTMYGPGTLDETMKRRSIYFFVKRSRLIPTMMLFDAPNALLSMASRPATTIAPQALHMMNSPQVRQYAQAFAQRLLANSDGSYESLVDTAYRIALSRPPTPQERADSVAFIKAAQLPYTKAGVSNDIEPAMAEFCQVLLGLNEFIYID